MGNKRIRGWFADRHHRWLLAVLVVATINFSAAFTWGVPQAVSAETTGAWPVDTIAPIPPLTEAYNRFTRTHAEWVIYPLFHYIVLDAAYAPYVLLQYLNGGLQNPSGDFPYGATNPPQFFGHLTLIARLVSLVMGLGIVVMIYFVTRRLFSPRAALASALITALMAPLAYYSSTSNLDVPYLFWVLMAVCQFVLILQQQRTASYVLLGVTIALAVATKDQAYGFFVLLPLALPLIVMLSSRDNATGLSRFFAAFLSKRVIVASVATAFTYAVANNLILGGWQGFLNHLTFISTFYNEKLLVEFPDIHTPGWQLSLGLQTVQVLTGILGPVVLLACAGGIAWAIAARRWLAVSLLLFPVGYYLAVTSAMGVVLPRYVLGVAILLTPFAGGLVDRAWTQRGMVSIAATLLFCAGIAWELLLAGHLNYTLINDSRYRLESWVREHVPTGATIESQLQHRYLPHLSDAYNLVVVGNAYDQISYDVVPTELTVAALKKRAPDYILVVENVGLTGDPAAQDHPGVTAYYRQLLDGTAGYEEAVRFETPNLLPYRQVKAGTLPTSVLLKRIDTDA